MVNSVEKCFYNHVNIDISVMDLIHINLRLGMLTNKRGATPAVASTVGTYNLRATGGASHNSFQQHFSEAINTNRSSAFTSTSTSTSKRRTSTSRATNFVNNGLWMENSTYNRDYLENNFAHNMVHQVHNSFCWISTLGIAQPRSSTTSSRSSSTSGSTTVLSSSTSGAHNSTSCHR